MLEQVEAAAETKPRGRRRAIEGPPVAVPDRILRPRETARTIGVSRSGLDLMWKRGDFPEPIVLTRNKGDAPSAVGWFLSTVLAWMRDPDGWRRERSEAGK